MNNFPLAGREIKVGTVADKTTGTQAGSTQYARPNLPSNLPNNPNNYNNNAGGTGANAAGNGQGNEGPLDEGTGGNLSQISRIELMQKLSRVDQGKEVAKVPMFRPNIPLATSRNM